MKMRINITIIFGDNSTSRIDRKIKEYESRTNNNYEKGCHIYKKYLLLTVCVGELPCLEFLFVQMYCYVDVFVRNT
jgi:hypothetical protein